MVNIIKLKIKSQKFRSLVQMTGDNLNTPFHNEPCKKTKIQFSSSAYIISLISDVLNLSKPQMCQR